MFFYIESEGKSIDKKLFSINVDPPFLHFSVFSPRFDPQITASQLLTFLLALHNFTDAPSTPSAVNQIFIRTLLAGPFQLSDINIRRITKLMGFHMSLEIRIIFLPERNPTSFSLYATWKNCSSCLFFPPFLYQIYKTIFSWIQSFINNRNVSFAENGTSTWPNFFHFGTKNESNFLLLLRDFKILSQNWVLFFFSLANHEFPAGEILPSKWTISPTHLILVLATKDQTGFCKHWAITNKDAIGLELLCNEDPVRLTKKKKKRNMPAAFFVW